MRFERRTDRDFKRSTRDNESNLLQRGRVTLDWKGDGKVSGMLQYQYAHNLYWKPAKNGSIDNNRLYQLNLKVKEANGTFTVGRQKINVGSERLIGSLEWANVARTLDAVRYQTKEWDVFAGAVGVSDPRPADAGIAAVVHPWQLGTTAFIYKSDKDPAGDINIWTLTHAGNYKFSGGDFEYEAAIQGGRAKSKDQEAWAFHAALNHPLDPKTKVTAEFNTASGGSSADKIRTFDNLYPTNHKFYGLMDLFAWKNMTHAMLTVSHKPKKDWDVKVRYAAGWLKDKKDAWYGASGKPNSSAGSPLIDPTGASGDELGSEADLEVNWKKSARESFQVGFGMFSPGDFVKNRTGDNKNQIFGYFMYSVRL